MRSNVSEDNLSARVLSPSYCGVRRKGNESDTRAAEFEKLKIDLRNTQDENLKLQAVISDLTQVNKRWQKYNSDRQMYVQKLLNTIQDQQEQLNKMGEQAAFSNLEEQQDDGSSKRNYEHEVARLQEVEMMLKERVQVLEFQVKANRDDWEAELNEKKQALKEKADIEGKVNELMNELQVLKQSILQKQRIEKRNVCDICRLRISNELAQPVNKLFRTAVHLPCSSHNWRGGVPEAASSCYNLEADGGSSEQTTQNGGGGEYLSSLTSQYLERRERAPSEGDWRECAGDFDSGLPRSESVDSCDVTADVWNIGEQCGAPSEVVTSYSRASTVPLVSSPVIHVTPSNSGSSVTLINAADAFAASMAASSAASMAACSGGVQYRARGVGVGCVDSPVPPVRSSVVHIPIAKSSSAPESKSSCSGLQSRSSFDSLDPPSSATDSADVIHPCDVTSSSQPLIEQASSSSKPDACLVCPVCECAFPSENHFKFLNHFEACQRKLGL